MHFHFSRIMMKKDFELHLDMQIYQRNASWSSEKGKRQVVYMHGTLLNERKKGGKQNMHQQSVLARSDPIRCKIWSSYKYIWWWCVCVGRPYISAYICMQMQYNVRWAGLVVTLVMCVSVYISLLHRSLVGVCGQEITIMESYVTWVYLHIISLMMLTSLLSSCRHSYYS